MKNNWQSKKLGEICQIEIGKTPYRGNSKYWDKEKESQNVWVSIADLLNVKNDRISDSREYISDEGARLSKIVKKGTLLVSFKLTLGRLAFAGRDLYTNEAIAALNVLNEKEISKEYLYKYLSFFDWNNSTNGDIKIKGKTLNKSKLKEIVIIFPSSQLEQKRIVKILDEFFKKTEIVRENVEKNLQNSRELFESYLENVFTNSNNWDIDNLGSVFDFKNGRSFKKSEWKQEGLPIIRIQNLNNEKSEFNFYMGEYSKDIEVNKGDLLFSWSGTVGSSFGPHIWKGKKGLLNQHIFKINYKKNIDTAFTFYFLKYITAKIERNVNGAVGLVHITKAKLNNFEMPVPSLVEQKKIVNKLDNIKKHTTKLEDIYRQKTINLKELRKSILNEAFSGKL